MLERALLINAEQTYSVNVQCRINNGTIFERTLASLQRWRKDPCDVRIDYVISSCVSFFFNFHGTKLYCFSWFQETKGTFKNAPKLRQASVFCSAFCLFLIRLQINKSDIWLNRGKMKCTVKSNLYMCLIKNQTFVISSVAWHSGNRSESEIKIRVWYVTWKSCSSRAQNFDTVSKSES